MKNIKIFENKTSYAEYINGTPEYPNVSFDGSNVYFNSRLTTRIGQVCYYNTSEEHLKFCNVSDYNSSLGPKVGVVVIPETLTPDGNARILSVYGVTSGGTSATSENTIVWGGYGTDTGLINYDKVPTWSNSAGSTIGNNSYGYAPSDKFNSVSCYDNSYVRYYNTGATPYIPPLLLSSIKLNPDVYVDILVDGVNHNALTDFNGKANTEALVALGSQYLAASACSAYSIPGMTSGWHLPSCGELAFILPKFTLLNSTLSSLGGVSLITNKHYLSSSEYNSNNTNYVDTYSGGVHHTNKNDGLYVRPFASVQVSSSCF